MGPSFALALLSFAALALAMRGHYRDIFTVECSRGRGRLLRGAGVVLLAASFTRHHGVADAVEWMIAWLCLASMAAIIIALLLGVATSLRARQSAQSNGLARGAAAPISRTSRNS